MFRRGPCQLPWQGPWSFALGDLPIDDDGRREKDGDDRTDRMAELIDPVARKVGWQEVGHVAQPGRYLFTFGWLTVTDADIAIWQSHPNAAFTLVRLPQPTPDPSADVAEEYHLGAIELRG